MENELKKGFLKRLAEQEPQKGWIVKWHPTTPLEGGRFFSASSSFVLSFVERKLKEGKTITIEPYTKMYKTEQNG